MTRDATTPSRRNVAKGAAWAVPAVAVAAAAPTLAASCEPSLSLSAVWPPIIGVDTRNVYFTLTNDGECPIDAGLAFTVDVSGLVGLTVGHLNAIQVDAGVLFSDANNGTITREIAPGETIEIEIVADSLLNADVVGSATLMAMGQSASVDFTAVEIDLPLLPSILVALCD